MVATTPPETRLRLSPMAATLHGSEILRIAAEIRELAGDGRRVYNFTVGDFDSKQFPIPLPLEEATIAALKGGETNYPPSAGLPVLREAVAAYYARELGLDVSPSNVLVTSGTRPGVYGAYRALVGPNERVVYGVPSWNNNYYVHLVGATAHAVECGPKESFLPSPSKLAPALEGARLLVLNSPLNPCGTAFAADALGEIADLVLKENARRSATEGPLFLLYDQVYWPITFGVPHVNPVTLRPEVAPYTVFVDGISKAFAATGMRVGWVVGPEAIVAAVDSILQHVGTWAPRAEQVAVARFLAMTDAVHQYRSWLNQALESRLDALYERLLLLGARGYGIDAVRPMGAIYLSAKIDLVGRRARGNALRSIEAVRQWLLREAAMGVVPFSAFGASDSPWWRLSVGAVSLGDIDEAMDTLARALEKLD
jgi:aspartate aminotransferase